MSILPIGSANTGILGKSLAMGDTISTAAINTDLRSCAPDIIEVAGGRDYQPPTACMFESYKVYVAPFGGADSSKYMLGTQHFLDDCGGAVRMIKELDLATKSLHFRSIGSGGIEDTIILPGTSDYVLFLTNMRTDISNTWHSKNSYSDTAAVPGMQGLYDFMQCVISSTGIKEPSKEVKSMRTSRPGSKATKIIIGANGRIDRSGQIFDIAGRPVLNNGRVPQGVYIYVQNKGGK